MTTSDTHARISKSIAESIAVKQRIMCDSAFLALLHTVGVAMTEVCLSGRKIFFLGNGGSAADAQHLTAEFTGRYLRERSPLPAMALTVNASSLTAIANDYSFEHIFARQLEELGTNGDLVIALSTSGNSVNVLRAMEVARRKGLVRVGMTGGSGGLLREMVEHCFCVPSQDTPRIQEAHIMIGHILCEIVEEELFG